jgi:hypothetical protein
MLGDELQDKLKRLLMHFMRKAAACLRQPRMIGSLVALASTKKISHRDFVNTLLEHVPRKLRDLCDENLIQRPYFARFPVARMIPSER